MPNSASILYHRVKLISEFCCHVILDAVSNLSLPYHLLTVCPLKHFSQFTQWILGVLSQSGEKMAILIDVIATGTIIRVEEKATQQTKGCKRQIIHHQRAVVWAFLVLSHFPSEMVSGLHTRKLRL